MRVSRGEVQVAVGKGKQEASDSGGRRGQRRKRSYRPLDDASAREVCKRIAEEYVSNKQACALAGVSYGTWSSKTTGDPAEEEVWAQWKEAAMASASSAWIKKAEKFATEKNIAGVRLSEFMLGALDRGRFGHGDGASKGGIVVNVLVGSGGGGLKATPVRVVGERLGLGSGESGGGLRELEAPCVEG